MNNITENTVVYNDQEYNAKIYLDNGSVQIPINTNAIVNLTIEETLADWVTRGVLSLYSAFELFEKKPDLPHSRLQPIDIFQFRNDGNDILRFELIPKLFDSGLNSSPRSRPTNLQMDKVHWKLNYEFSIYDVEDVDHPPGAQNAAAPSIKIKKLYFYDRWHQLMLTDFMEFSTALTQRGSQQIAGYPISSIPDTARAVPTGYAIKEIFKKCLIENAGIGLSENIISNDWDEGSSSIFFTAPASYTASDSLKYIYDRHVSEVGSPANTYDFSILTKEKGPTENDIGSLVLRPVSKFFEEAGTTQPKKFQIEHFYVQEYGEPISTPGINKVPKTEGNDLQIDTKLGSYSYITNYRFVDIAPSTNFENFRTKSVHSIDFLNRALFVEYQTNKAETARDFISNKYNSQVSTIASGKDNFLITLDNRKRSRNIEPTFSLYGGNLFIDSLNRQADGLQKLLRTGLFLNACIHFRVLGSTNRETGRFIAIDRASSITDSPFNDKFYGQWFTINIRHIFENNIYYNEITAIKTHRFQKSSVNLNNTI